MTKIYSILMFFAGFIAIYASITNQELETAQRTIVSMFGTITIFAGIAHWKVK